MRFRIATAAVLFTSMMAQAQTPPARITAAGGITSLHRSGEMSPTSPGVTIMQNDMIRTEGASFLAIETQSQTVVLLGEHTEIVVQELGTTPIVVLQRGILKVSAPTTDVLVKTKAGEFSSAERPFEFELDASRAPFIVSVAAGSLKMNQIDTAAVIFRGSSNSAFRTYTSGFFRSRNFFVAPIYPQIWLQPNVMSPYSTGPSQIIPPMTDPLRPPVHFPAR